MTVNFINYSETWLLVPVYLSVWIHICFVFICFQKECKFWRKLQLKMHVDSKTIYPIDIHVIKVQITSVLFRLYNTINTIILGENTIKVTHSCFFFNFLGWEGVGKIAWYNNIIFIFRLYFLFVFIFISSFFVVCMAHTLAHMTYMASTVIHMACTLGRPVWFWWYNFVTMSLINCFT